MKEEKNEWYKNNFENISESIKKEESLSYYNFLRIRNFKMNLSSRAEERSVREATEKAFKLASEGKIKESINVLIESLHGVGIPIASAILAMRFHNHGIDKEFAIIDTLVIDALKNRNYIDDGKRNLWQRYYLDKSDRGLSIYEEYIKLIRKIVKEGCNKYKSLRDLERELWENENKQRQRNKKIAKGSQ